MALAEQFRVSTLSAARGGTKIPGPGAVEVGGAGGGGGGSEEERVGGVEDGIDREAAGRRSGRNAQWREEGKGDMSLAEPASGGSLATGGDARRHLRESGIDDAGRRESRCPPGTIGREIELKVGLPAGRRDKELRYIEAPQVGLKMVLARLRVEKGRG